MCAAKGKYFHLLTLKFFLIRVTVRFDKSILFFFSARARCLTCRDVANGLPAHSLRVSKAELAGTSLTWERCANVCRSSCKQGNVHCPPKPFIVWANGKRLFRNHSMFLGSKNIVRNKCFVYAQTEEPLENKFELVVLGYTPTKFLCLFVMAICSRNCNGYD